jgi:hypothetical protein
LIWAPDRRTITGTILVLKAFKIDLTRALNIGAYMMNDPNSEAHREIIKEMGMHAGIIWCQVSLP